MIKLARFHPKLFDHLKGYTRQTFFKDLISGTTVGFVALPLAIAFAIASGLKPEAGLIAAVVGGFLISALGGSKVQIGGPAGAFIVIVFGIVERYGVPNLILSTFLAGILLFTLGLLRVGGLIRFIPVAIIIGFTSGIAVLIGMSQVKDILGLEIDKLPGDFFSQINTYLKQLHTFDLDTFLLGLGSLVLIVLWPRLTQPFARVFQWITLIPGMVAALVIGTLVAHTFDLTVATIGTRFGELPRGLPAPTVPSLDWETAKQLFAPTITIAFLGAIESLLCARVADHHVEDKHDPNQELMAQGIANIVVPFFGGLPVTGTIARTVTNAKAGAQSPVSGIVHALVILIVMLIAAPLASHIPMATLAAILLFVAWSMFDRMEFKRAQQFNLTYRSILLGTFLLTVIFDLTVAVQVGLVLSCAFFIYRISTLTHIEKIDLPEDLHPEEDLPLQESSSLRVEAYRIYGSLFFGAVDKIENLFNPLDTSKPAPDVLILEMHQLINIDTSGMDALFNLAKDLGKRGGTLVVCAANKQPLSLMARSGFVQEIGEENLQISLDEACERARQIVYNSCKVSVG